MKNVTKESQPVSLLPFRFFYYKALILKASWFSPQLCSDHTLLVSSCHKMKCFDKSGYRSHQQGIQKPKSIHDTASVVELSLSGGSINNMRLQLFSFLSFCLWSKCHRCVVQLIAIIL